MLDFAYFCCSYIIYRCLAMMTTWELALFKCYLFCYQICSIKYWNIKHDKYSNPSPLSQNPLIMFFPFWCTLEPNSGENSYCKSCNEGLPTHFHSLTCYLSVRLLQLPLNNLQSHPQLFTPAISSNSFQNITQTILFASPKTSCSLAPSLLPPMLTSMTSPEPLPSFGTPPLVWLSLTLSADC